MAWPYKQNQPQEFDFPLFDADGDLVNESGTITGQVSINGQGFVSVSGSINQYGTTGVYKFSGTAEDWNGYRLTFKITSPIVKPTVLTFHTDSKQFADIPTLADLKAQAENALTAFSPLKSSVSGRFLDVSAGGEAGVDWGNVGSQATPVNLSATTISGVNSAAPPGPTTQDIWSYTSRGLTDKSSFSLAADQTTVRFSGYVSDPGKAPTTQDIWSFVSRVITDKSDFFLAANQSGVTIEAVSGAVGSVTGNVGGSVVGSVGSVSQSGISPATMGADVLEQIAAAVIRRGMVRDETGLENRSLGWAIAKLVNKIDLNAAGDTLTVRRTNDSTALFTQAITTSGGASPITAVDTA